MWAASPGAPDGLSALPRWRRWLHGARVDEPLAFEAYGPDPTPGAGAARELHADRLGSVVAVVDPALAVVEARAAG